MVNVIDQKSGIERRNTPTQTMDKGATLEIQKDVSEQTLEFVEIGAREGTRREIFEAVSSGSTGSAPMTPTHRHHLQQAIARVHTFTKDKLVQGITTELNHEVEILIQKAKKIQHSLKKFSAYELNMVLSQIRKLKDELMQLIKFSIEKLRELYIRLVLKLRLVAVN